MGKIMANIGDQLSDMRQRLLVTSVESLDHVKIFSDISFSSGNKFPF
jgi:hypothetical protein